MNNSVQGPVAAILDTVAFLFMLGACKKMLTKPRCSICSSRFGCNHSSGTRTWQDEEHLGYISLGEKMTDITNPQAILHGAKSSESNNDTVIKTMNLTDEKPSFVKCNLCGHEVVQHYLTRHIGMHIENKYIEEANVRVADSTVRSIATNFPVTKEELVEVKEEDVRNFLNAMPLSKVKDTEDFVFRKIKDVSAFSGTSKDGRYSDFTLLVWFSDITSTTTYNAGYVGGHNSFYGKASERIQVHLTYDSLENYFTVSGRSYKKLSYSDYETEEGSIPDRICDQEELLVEMRRIFLFFKVSPKAVYKRFLKTIRMGHTMVNSEGAEPQAVTTNHVAILEDLKKAKTSAKIHDSDEYQMYGC